MEKEWLNRQIKLHNVPIWRYTMLYCNANKFNQGVFMVLIIIALLIGTATGVEVSAQYPHISQEVNHFQHTTPAK